MRDTQAFKGFALGMMVALVCTLGALPVFARATSSAGQATRLGPQGNEFTSSPLMIPAAAFVYDGYAPTSYWFSFADGYLAGNSEANGCMEAAVYLPSLAHLDGFYVYLYDNDAGTNVTATLHRVRTTTGVGQVLATVSTNGADTNIQYLGTNNVNPDDVSNLYAYYVTTCLSSANTRLYGARVFYHINRIYLPHVNKN